MLNVSAMTCWLIILTLSFNVPYNLAADRVRLQVPHGVTITAIPHGIQLQQEPNLIIQEAAWTLLVTLDPPNTNQDVLRLLSQVRHLVKNPNSTVYPDIQHNWNIRLNSVQSACSQPNARIKRAPLDFIGEISHSLFGTVTESELSVYREALSQVSKSLNKTIHRNNALLTVTKINRQAINVNRVAINDLARTQSRLNTRYLYILKEVDNKFASRWTYWIIEHLINNLESIANQCRSLSNTFHHQISALQSEHLTSGILSTSQFHEIQSRVAALGYHTLPMSWYVRFCPVHKLYHHRSLIYAVALPLHKNKNQLLYSLHSYPVPLSQGHFSLMRVLTPVAADTHSGLVYQPQHCLGSHPRLCRHGPLEHSSKLICEKGLINANPDLTRHCKIKIIAREGSLVSAVTPGRFVLSAIASQWFIRCLNQPESRIHIDKGVYFVGLSHKCVLQNSQWTLNGYDQLNKSIFVNSALVNTDFSLHNLHLKKSLVHHLAAVSTWMPLHSLPNISMPTLKPLSLSLPPANTSHVLSISSMATVSIIAIALLIALLLYYRFCRSSASPGVQTPPPTAPSLPNWTEMLRTCSQPSNITPRHSGS